MMENKNYLRIENGPEIWFVGTAKALADMVKEWIVEELYSIPDENGRSFYKDEEFQDALETADELDTLAREYGDFQLFQIHYTDGEEWITDRYIERLGVTGYDHGDGCITERRG